MAIRALTLYNELPRKKQVAILAALPAVPILIFGYLLYRELGVLGDDPGDHLPAFMHRPSPDSLYGQIADINAQIQTEETEAEKLKSVQALVNSLKAQFEDAKVRLPKVSEKTEMRLMLEKLARDIPSDIGTVQVLSVRIVEDTGQGSARSGPASALQKISYLIEITGDLNGVIKYIDLIEKNPHFWVVSSIIIKPGKVSVDSEKKLVLTPHTVHLGLNTFIYNGDAVAPTGGGR